MFDADRQTDRRVADADLSAQLGGYARVRCGAWMAGEGLGSSEADGELEDLHPVETRERLREPAFDVEGKGRAGARTLRLIDSPLRCIRGQKRQIVHLCHPWMIAQELG